METKKRKKKKDRLKCRSLAFSVKPYLTHLTLFMSWTFYSTKMWKKSEKNMKNICILSLIAKLIFLLQSSPSKFPFAGKDLDYTALSPLLYRYVMQFSWHCSSENFVFESKWENLLKILNKKKWTNMLKNTKKHIYLPARACIKRCVTLTYALISFYLYLDHDLESWQWLCIERCVTQVYVWMLSWLRKGWDTYDLRESG